MEHNTTDLIESPGAEPFWAAQQMRAGREEEVMMLRRGCELVTCALAAIAERRNTSRTVAFSAAIESRRGKAKCYSK